MFALYGDCFILLKATIYITFHQTESSQRIFESEKCFSDWGGEQLSPPPLVQQGLTTMTCRQFARDYFPFFFFPSARESSK